MPRTQQDLSAARSSTIILRYEDRSLLIKRDPCYSVTLPLPNPPPSPSSPSASLQKAIRDIQLALRRSFAGVPSSRITLHAKVTGYGNEEHEITAPVWPDVVSHLHHITVNVHRKRPPSARALQRSSHFVLTRSLLQKAPPSRNPVSTSWM
ncbi:hypothetical protein OF83DRAFT_1081469 [Amylostereum chailletii]|nr:hypothetical protein OF83DRAFT_1081469 [Amylostereum chailletii]